LKTAQKIRNCSTAGCRRTEQCARERWYAIVVPSPPRQPKPKVVRNTRIPGTGKKMRPMAARRWTRTR